MTVTALAQIAIAGLGGGGATIIAQALGGWWRSRGDRYAVDRKAEAQVDVSRDTLTIELLKQAREDIAAARAETVSVHLVHLEEALDHLHALLNSETDAERRTAEKRARAFLRRMRPEIGDLRNQRQVSRSARKLAERDGFVPAEGEE